MKEKAIGILEGKRFDMWTWRDDDFCSGDIKVLACLRFEGGGVHYLWSSRESDAEVTESDVTEIEQNFGLKIEKLTIYKLHKHYHKGSQCKL